MKVIGKQGKGHLRGQSVKFFKNAPIELKVTWNYPSDIINILKIQQLQVIHSHVIFPTFLIKKVKANISAS